MSVQKIDEMAYKQNTLSDSEPLDNMSITEEEPQDLLSFKQLCTKHGYNYDYLYKYSILKGQIPVYDRGTWKLSESEVLEFSRKVKEKKLSKIRSIKGGE